jgi:precorrin-8X/cobalt-precorrin-8 methylmutase
MIELQRVLPAEIEKRSFEIIGEELKEQGITLDPVNEPVIKRAIHTSADFEYANALVFSDNVVNDIVELFKNKEEKITIVTDTNMARAGVNKAICAKLGVEVKCFMSELDVAEAAKKNGSTRAVASMEKAAAIEGNIIFAIGNAPTALVKLDELIKDGKVNPKLVIGVPVGFVNVVESKEIILERNVPYIVARGRKGGSNVAAAICNALMYMTGER